MRNARHSGRRAQTAFQRSGQYFGLAFLFLGIFQEKPAFFAASIAALLVAIPIRELIRRAFKFRVELLVICGLIVIQLAAESQFSALIVTMYLMGFINGIVLPDPKNFPPRSWWLLIAVSLAAWLLSSSGISDLLGLKATESVFGANTDEYQIDLRSLSYAFFIVTLYLTPHFKGLTGGAQAVLLALASTAGSNKFGMLYAALCKAAPAVVLPMVLATAGTFATLGFAQIDFTAARAALWSDFFSNFPHCDALYGACTELIVLNNEEGVRSFHSIALDFAWYGGAFGLLGAVFFLVRMLLVRSLFGRSAAVLFAVAMLFGFPPFFNERHVFVIYAFLVLFQEGRARGVHDRALRKSRPVPVQG